MRQSLLRNRTVWRIWDVVKGEWWSPERHRKKRANDLYLTRHTVNQEIADQANASPDWRGNARNNENLVAVECDLVPRDPFYRELIARTSKEST